MSVCVNLQGDPLWSARMIKTNPDAISDVHSRCSLHCVAHYHVILTDEVLIHMHDGREIFWSENKAITE